MLPGKVARDNRNMALKQTTNYVEDSLGVFRQYKNLAERAIEQVKDEALFAEIVYEAAVDAMANVTVVEKRMQGRDHPVLLGVPETYYLKCFVLRKL